MTWFSYYLLNDNVVVGRLVCDHCFLKIGYNIMYLVEMIEAHACSPWSSMFVIYVLMTLVLRTREYIVKFKFDSFIIKSECVYVFTEHLNRLTSFF